MNPCECGCAGMARTGNRFIRGHHLRKKQNWPTPKTELDKLTVEVAAPVIAAILPTTVTDGPPEYPHPIDRSRWRLAEDRPGTPPTNRWIKTQCHSCLLPMWTKDTLSTWERGGVCEECGYLMREDLSSQVAKRNGAAAKPYDPFA